MGKYALTLRLFPASSTTAFKACICRFSLKCLGLTLGRCFSFGTLGFETTRLA